jgi:hypothetical protein
MYNIYVTLVALIVLMAVFTRLAFKKLHEVELDNKLGRQHGCLPAPKIQNQRPLGLDRMEQIFRGDAESRLMELFLFHFRQTGNTVKHVFLSITAYATCDPANIEAIQSTNFKGNLHWLENAYYFHVNKYPRLGNGTT